MALKLPDSAVPMGDFPVAKAVDIDFDDGENLQDKFDNGELGGGGSGSSEKQIKDWVSGSSYSEGDYIYHEGEIYRCLATNNNVDFDETNWKKLTYGIDELSKEDVERLLGLTKEEIEAMADLILDTEVRIDKTYSSSKIYTDIQQCLEDSKTYTLLELGKFSGVSYKIVASTSEMTSESIIYLLANGNTYDMYIVEENGATTKIGDTNVNLSDYYTKTEVDNDFLKKVDADGKYATITTVDGKVDKNKIVTVLNDSVTDDEVPSARLVYEELDKKFEGDNFVKKTDITNTIDIINSSGMKIPNVKAIYDDIIEGKVIDQTVIDKYGTEILKYPLGIWRIGGDSLSTKFSDLPVKTSGRIEIASIDANINKTPWNNTWSYRTYTFETHSGMNYLRKLSNGGTAGVIEHDTDWQKVCVTKVADIPKTTLTPVFPGEVKVASGGVAINYVVKNGWCNVNFAFNLASATTFPWTGIATGLPIPANNVNTLLTDETGKLNRNIAIRINSTGTVASRIQVAFTAVDWWTGNISYPVAE